MQAFITLLSSPDYVPGVLCLARSLRRTGTRYALYVGISHGVPRQAEAALQHEGLNTLRLPARSPLPRTHEQKGHHWSHTFDKLHVFGLTQFDKLVYLDSDMMVLTDIDALFQAPHMSAVAAGQLLYPEWVRMNSGLMVVEPESGLPTRIGATLDKALAEAAADGRRAIGDQDLINTYYPDWPRREQLHLDQAYNVFYPDVDAYARTGRYVFPGLTNVPTAAAPIRVLHFVGKRKPWMTRSALRHQARRAAGRISPLERHAFLMYRRLLRDPGRHL